MKKNTVKILICILILISLPLSVFAVQKAIKPTSQTGEYEQKLLDRVNLSVENTDFVITKTSDGEETFYITFNFSAQKTEADFYAKINSFSISGIEFENIIFTADEQNGTSVNPDSLVLSAKDDKPIQYKWTAQMTFNITEKGVYTPILEIDYTSGTSKENSEDRYFSVPLTITVK